MLDGRGRMCTARVGYKNYRRYIYFQLDPYSISVSPLTSLIE